MKKMLMVTILVLALMIPTLALADSYADADAKAKASGVGVGTAVVESTQQLIPNTTIIPNPVPLIQGGRVGDVTAQMPTFAYVGLTPLAKGDKVIDLKVKSGSIFDRIRLEDIELDLIAFYKGTIGGDWKPEKMRYLVQYKDSVFGAAMSGGGQAGTSALSNTGVGFQGSGGIIPSVGRSTADPMYVLKLYLIQ